VSTTSRTALALAVALVLAASGALAGEPLSFFDGRLRLGGEVSGTLSPEDEGYFNYNDYETSTLRLFRIDLMAEARLAPSLSLLFDGRIDNLAEPRVYALYLRLRPWRERELDLQAGLVPPVFGAFARRRYALDNPLPSLPLAYQYLVTMRADAMPWNTEQVIFWRGRGWQFSYPIGNVTPGPGLPLVSAERWDAGVQARFGVRPLSLAVSVTQGTLSHPQVEDGNGGKQVSARLAWTPSPALVVGVSAASGEFLDDGVTESAPPDVVVEQAPERPDRQRALGLDLEWSAGHLILRGEAVWSRWQLPPLDVECDCSPSTRLEQPLDALGLYAEARYKLRPGLYLAGRVEHLAMSALESRISPAGATSPPSWDAAVSRIEVGAGYRPARHVLLKASWQHNWRDGGRVEANHLVAAQVLLWF
jgi:hypothetical protein